MNESIVILSSYQFTAVALTQKLLNGFHDSLVPLVVCAGWARPKKKVIIKVSHSVVAKGTVCVWGGGGGGEGTSKAVRHNRNFCNFFNLNFTVSNKA